ncbi:transmembrane protein, putative [Bodo saltans]|uniref:Transmembrane protein, putative n=1 Tax=Bodo saltans TaxID=75058 RepID=A0A0S4J3W8_BODSA|nr:transmembrane protein, putative [Bodo saltans]|eukprot:CUG75000.1 transmembrane protein, putative [Bodo saltans]
MIAEIASTVAPRAEDPAWAVFITTVVSHLTLIAPIKQLLERRWMFEVSISIFGLCCSFMYHTCQSFDTRIFLTELQWHRLDNIGVLCSFGIFWTYMACIESPVTEAYVKYLCVFVTLLAQECDPWNELYTFVPVVLFSMIPFYFHIFVHQRWPRYDKKNFLAGFGLLAAALPFFVAGLDDANDPFRIFHGLWHLFVGISSFYLWRIVKQPGAVALQPLRDRVLLVR